MSRPAARPFEPANNLSVTETHNFDSSPDFDFDFKHIAVPFAMRPGLSRLAPDTRQLTPLVPCSALHAEKQQIEKAGLSRHAVAGFDHRLAMQTISAHARINWPECPFDDECSLESTFEEDFAVLDGASGTLPWLCVCTPSHWAPEEKVGLHFAALHAPVADGAALRAAAAPLVQLVTGGGSWERFVWTLSPSNRYDQHPHRHGRPPWPDEPDPAAFAAQTFFRVERQTFLPVGQGSSQAVFTIRVMLKPLVQAVDTPEKARRLQGSLASRSDAVLAYKGLTEARGQLLRWLQRRFS